MKQNKKSRLRLIILSPVLLFAIWGLGFLVFKAAVNQSTDLDTVISADNAGIAALTGGKGRLEAGVALLKKGVGKRLLISGVHTSVTTDDISRRLQVDQVTLDCCIDVDHVSSDTIENAKTSLKWVEANNFSTLYLVTSSYHMPRSLRLVKSQAENLIIVPIYVKDEQTLSAIITEYNKYVFTLGQTLF